MKLDSALGVGRGNRKKVPCREISNKSYAYQVPTKNSILLHDNIFKAMLIPTLRVVEPF